MVRVQQEGRPWLAPHRGTARGATCSHREQHAPPLQCAPAVNLVVTQDYEESLARVVTGQADAAALNFSAGARIADRLYPGQMTLPGVMFYEQLFAVGVPKGQSAKLLAELDAGLAAIRADGTWQQISNRWTGN